MMRNLKSTLLSCAALLLVFLSSCAPQVEELDNLAGPQADEEASSYTFYALIPGTLDNVSQMDLTIYPDGTSEASRSVIPFDPDLNYSTYQLVGASETVEVGGDLQVNFTEKTWFIPFDKQVSPSIILETEGSLILNCWCSGLGNCTTTSTIGYHRITSAECVGVGCTSNCVYQFFHETSAPVSIPGVVIAASSVSTN